MSDAPAVFKKLNKSKKSSTTRKVVKSDHEDEGDARPEVFRPKKIVQSQVFRKSLPLRTAISEKSSLYSSDYLNQLRDSTPSTPREFVAVNSENDSLSDQQAISAAPSIIPGDATIKLAKQRREMRRAPGNDYISLVDGPAETESIRDANYGKRIQTEDDIDKYGGDGNEGMDGYESDDLNLSRDSTRKADRLKKAHIEEVLEDAHLQDYSGFQSDDTDTDASADSDNEWEATQVRKSAGLAAKVDAEDRPASTPEVVTIPSVEQLILKLQKYLDQNLQNLQSKRRALEAIQKEKLDIADQEASIKGKLQEASETYESLTSQIGGPGFFTSIEQFQ